MGRGYPAYKLHTWQPPYAGAPNPRRDIEACAAVRDAVGPGVPLMLDPYHYYDREAALYLAKRLEELDYLRGSGDRGLGRRLGGQIAIVPALY